MYYRNQHEKRKLMEIKVYQKTCTWSSPQMSKKTAITVKVAKANKSNGLLALAPEEQEMEMYWWSCGCRNQSRDHQRWKLIWLCINHAVTGENHGNSSTHLRVTSVVHYCSQFQMVHLVHSLKKKLRALCVYVCVSCNYKSAQSIKL